MKKLLLFLVLTLGVVYGYGQSISGQVVDKSGTPIIGSSVLIKGTTVGTITDIDGKFTLNYENLPDPVLKISYIGFQSMNMSIPEGGGDMGMITLDAGTVGLEEIVVVGIADIAKDRKTPVAVSTITSSEILAKLGNQELPEMLKFTPSIYTTKQGGGFGDSRINVRGFTQENTAVLINGVPVNDMENGAVYWSNWTGLADVTSAMQVQRGLGSSKIAISSVGGTVNIITKVTDNDKGGRIGVTLGNDGYLKTVASVNTGKMSNGIAVSALLGRTAGDGYALGTEFEGYNYFLGMGWTDKSNRHNLQFVVTGAPQVHGQRTSSYFNMATLEKYEEYGAKYNFNHGTLANENFGWRKNFYHKPVASVNYDVKISDRMKLSSVAYASYGRGGGTGDIGRLGGDFNYASSSKFRDDNGEVMWDEIINSNSGGMGAFSNDFSYSNPMDSLTGKFIVNDDEISGTEGDFAYVAGAERRNGFVRRASVNSHNWLGLLSNLNISLTDNLTFDVGLDLRNYKGIHYRRLDNLLGADGYRDNDDINNPFRVVTQTNDSDLSSLWNVFQNSDDEVKINYYNDGLVNWIGGFGQLEYSTGALTAFMQGSVSNQGFQRIDYFTYADSDPAQTSDKVNILGGNIKGGANYNINKNHNVFGNIGYYSKQPNFDAIFLNFRNEVNENRENEKITGMEIGYGYRSGMFRGNVNLYRTTWADRFFRNDVELSDGTEGSASFQGLKQVHMGIEFDGQAKLSDMFRINGMISLNDWQYEGNVKADVVDRNLDKVGEFTLFLDGVPVGDAAQTTARLGIDVRPIKGLRFDVDWFYATNLYADFVFNSDNFVGDFGGEDPEILELPAYSLFDVGLGYTFWFGKNDSQALGIRLNVNNALNTKYLSESKNNYAASEVEAENWNGVNMRNRVFFGFGRTWNLGINYSF